MRKKCQHAGAGVTARHRSAYHYLYLTHDFQLKLQHRKCFPSLLTLGGNEFPALFPVFSSGIILLLPTPLVVLVLGRPS